MKMVRPMGRQAVASAAALLVLVPVLSACGGSSGSSSGGSAGTTKLTVFAASSLTGVFTTLASDFEKSHSSVDVVLSFDSSTTLAEQVKAGAPADVLATADDKSIGIAADAGDLAAAPKQFTTNTLTVVTPPDNPGHVSSVKDLSGTDFVVCDPTVPCGAAAATILGNAGVTAKPKSLEADVKSVLAKITLGEADAGIVYVTDAKAAGAKVKTVAIPGNLNVINPYEIGVVKASSQSALAQQFLALVTSQAGQGVLTDAGFGSS